MGWPVLTVQEHSGLLTYSTFPEILQIAKMELATATPLFSLSNQHATRAFHQLLFGLLEPTVSTKHAFLWI